MTASVEKGPGKSATDSPRKVRPGRRGWIGRGRGEDVVVEAADEFRGTTKQVCGLWPWIVGSGTPMIGVPMGRHITTGSTLCCDPISWYQRGGLIGQPSAFMLGLPSLGKTSAVMRMCVGLAGYGVIPMVLGDTRPDYTRMIRKLGGEPAPIGRNRGSINLLDPGEVPDAARRLREAGHEKLAEELVADSQARRMKMLEMVILVLRPEIKSISPIESTILNRALRHLDEHFDGVPLPTDLLELIKQAPPALEDAALANGDPAKYAETTRELKACLMALGEEGAFGTVFARHTTHPMRRDVPMSYDLSGIHHSETALRALALVACWNAGFTSVGIAQVLADAGLEPRRHYFLVLDELHQALKAGSGLVDRVDYLTRLNRTEGVGMIMITHTLEDLMAVPNPEDRHKTLGFIDRAAITFLGGLPSGELDRLAGRVGGLSNAERSLITGWSNPAPFDPRTMKKGTPPGRGKFLIKIGDRPGIPFTTILTKDEVDLSMSDARWGEASRNSRRDEPED